MPILIALLALIALVYGAVRAFDALQAARGRRWPWASPCS